MNISWNFNITLHWIHIPVIPVISFTKVEIDHDGADCCESCRNLSAGTAPEEEILPIPVKRKARIKPSNEDVEPRNFDPELRYRRLVGEMRGTEKYRSLHVRRDLIQWLLERTNSPLTLVQLQNMKKSPFNHKWEKCNPECTHRIVSIGVLRKVLRNDRTKKEIRKGIPQVVTFEKVKKGYRLTKDFYKSVYGRDTLIDQWQPPTPQAQIPSETTTVANWVKENTDIRR
jgi:hypothetical protein